jgi:hypothetical protein
MAIERGLTPVENIPETSPIKQKMATEHVMTEQEAMQEEVITRVPGVVAFLINYEMKPLLKIIGIVLAIAALYFFFGIDVVLSSGALFGIVAVMVYMLQLRNQKADYTKFFEVKKAGQIVEMGDHSPYKNSFIVQSDRVAMWLVPNHLIRRTLFKLPAGYEMPPLPTMGDNVVYVDMFDEYNRTCVMPRSPDVANIAFETNMNPLFAKKLSNIALAVDHAERVEREATKLYRNGQITLEQLRSLLKRSHVERINALSNPMARRRDIIFDLQRTVPEFQDKIRYLQDNIYLLADEMATAGIYQLLKIPMPDKIREDHNFIRTLYGLPKVKGMKQRERVNVAIEKNPNMG